MNFSGSYQQDEVTFLLKQLLPLPVIDLVLKEQLIQSGTRHYSEMLSPEILPSPSYLEAFRHACEVNRKQMARGCLMLAAYIAQQREGAITLVSLVRAGTPVGVILKHLLEQVFKRKVKHYSLSIIRDRGIDAVALSHILIQGHAPESIVFIDGWTGKGVISRELMKAVSDFNQKHSVSIDPGLYVLSDLAGCAAYAASSDDYLIPSSILNATVSGLVSRSVLNESIGPAEFHGCVYYKEFEPYDLSRKFVEDVVNEGIAQAKDGLPVPMLFDSADKTAVSLEFIFTTMSKHGITDENLIKPGIGEATRVLLRRVPQVLILRNPSSIDVSHLRLLAAEKSVPVTVDSNLPYQAVAIIRSTLGAK